MSDKFVCYTLFNITKTGVLNRSKPTENEDIELWVKRRNSQCNFDTILQAISLRSQPESITEPKKVNISLQDTDYFGFLYKSQHEQVLCWKFTFEVQHSSVFSDEDSPLGALYRDVDEVPMIDSEEQSIHFPTFLDTTPELKNIHFVRLDDEK